MIELHWLKTLNRLRSQQLIALYNAVIEKDNTLGYANQLSLADERFLLHSLKYGLKNKSKFLLIAKNTDNNSLVGSVTLARNMDSNCNYIGELQKGMVHPQFRGGTIKRQLFSEVLNKCVVLGIELLKLDVREGSRAEKLWHYLGFEKYGRLKNYAKVGDETYPGIFMYQTIENLLLRQTQGREEKYVR